MLKQKQKCIKIMHQLIALTLFSLALSSCSNDEKSVSATLTTAQEKSNTNAANKSNEEYLIASFIAALKDGDPEAIAQYIHPDGVSVNSCPALSIKSGSDLIANFEYLFDASHISTITSSLPERDWDVVGLRGIMFANGDLWLSSDGKLFAINYETEATKASTSCSDSLLAQRAQREQERLAEATTTIQSQSRVDTIAQVTTTAVMPPNSRVSKISECSVLTSQMAAYHATLGNFDLSGDLMTGSRIIAETAKSIGKSDGYTEQQVIEIEKQWESVFKQYLEDQMPLSEWGNMMEGKMINCTTLLASSEDILGAFRLNANQASSSQAQNITITLKQAKQDSAFCEVHFEITNNTDLNITRFHPVFLYRYPDGNFLEKEWINSVRVRPNATITEDWLLDLRCKEIGSIEYSEHYGGLHVDGETLSDSDADRILSGIKMQSDVMTIKAP